MSANRLLGHKNWIPFNRDIAKCIGIEATLMLSELAARESLYIDEETIQKDGWFYLTVKTVEDSIVLKKVQQQRGIKILKELKLIETKLSGMPAKRYFRLNPNCFIIISKMIAKALSKKPSNKLVKIKPTSKSKSSQQDGTNQANKLVDIEPQYITNKKELNKIYKEKFNKKILNDSNGSPTTDNETGIETIKSLKSKKKIKPKSKAVKETENPNDAFEKMCNKPDLSEIEALGPEGQMIWYFKKLFPSEIITKNEFNAFKQLKFKIATKLSNDNKNTNTNSYKPNKSEIVRFFKRLWIKKVPAFYLNPKYFSIFHLEKHFNSINNQAKQENKNSSAQNLTAKDIKDEMIAFYQKNENERKELLNAKKFREQRHLKIYIHNFSLCYDQTDKWDFKNFEKAEATQVKHERFLKYAFM